PYLASRWDLDSTGVTFYLNRDVRWHDGTPVTAHDVAFTFDRAKNPETASVLA
ncbi:MAG: peptide ABC transporter substrate-binding protein, partial [Gemmatimonadetes bacterium]|nr:peptide ABC transporter substrate-binding protein [Gemmatimonadota bacterium]NIS00547.1 peptide ABC transporter substrate-binding protein [Gemmatimonadota bacterium]NIT66208.1 peptide ABC transporter substrate-binding protein [Gemmatimonadota bacterium]NIU52312.1 peptide ABC transporter substrate-binding protein [Gemmatimonadota bacterium]NIV22773.1 peptide ABC transporter substrate-binding protein [Gemmatimonadota bacterium]